MKDFKFFADVNIERYIIDKLLEYGYDIKSALNFNKYAEDQEIIKIANKEKRILLTNDKDFGELIYRQKLVSNGVILFRLKSQDEMLKFNLLDKFVLPKEVEKITNKFIVISERKIRIIPL